RRCAQALRWGHAPSRPAPDPGPPHRLRRVPGGLRRDDPAGRRDRHHHGPRPQAGLRPPDQHGSPGDRHRARPPRRLRAPPPPLARGGTRRRGLQVTGTDGSTLTVGRALGRSAAKIFVPWQLGHASAIGAAWEGFRKRDPLTWASTVTVYTLIGLYAWTGLRG